MNRIVTLPPGGELRPDGTVAAGWWHEDEASGRLVCDLCPRLCHLKPGDRGFCFVRQNVDGEMVLTTYGKSTGFCIDPIEKKPLTHFYPGSSVLSFGTAGCNLGCKFCQNWDISKSREVARLSEAATPEAIAEAAVRHGCRSVAFTYNDPVIWAEYAIDTARACRDRGVKAVAVTSGYISPAARGPFFEVMDAANVDLKAFSETFYEHVTSSHLQPVLDTLEWLHKETDCWFEITNLVIPRENDTDDELRRLCEWVLAHCGDEVPVHFTAFHPDFRMRDRPLTPLATLLRAHAIAKAEGLKHVYTGNVDDVRHQSTYCAGCGNLLISRNRYELGEHFMKGDRCGFCGVALAGWFGEGPGNWGRRRQPISIAEFARGASEGGKGRSEDRDVKVVQIQPGDAGRPAPAANESSPAPRLDALQKAQVLSAAAEFVAGAVLRRAAHVPDAGLAGAASLPVAGAYVTLKRRSQLRACTGLLGQPVRLFDALRGASYQTATDDRRLPPISPGELPFLDLTVNLLFGFRPLDARGADRLAAVEVGRHGLRLKRGDAAGLLLPCVATEHGWDAVTFLRQACRKAGLPSTAWEDDATALWTFEAVEVDGPLAAALVKELPEPGATGPSVEDVRQLAAHALGNVHALARGMAASYYTYGVPDGTVAGVGLTIAGLPGGGSRHFTRVVLRPGVALQATVYALAESAARAVAAVPHDPRVLRLGLTVFSDPAMHGTLATPDFRGFDPVQRALLSIEGDKLAWAFDPSASPEGLLVTVREGIDPKSPGQAGLYSLAARSTEAAATFDSRPRPVVRTGARPPSAAGTFYPADDGELSRLVDSLLAASELRPGRWAAAMVPHAGLVYSGRLAAAVLNRLEFPGLIVVIGPKHTRLGVDWAVAPNDAWSIPGATVAGDPAFARRLAEAVPGLALDSTAHEKEHAIEVELPLIARRAPGSRVVGVAVGGGDWDHCRRFAEGLSDFLRGESERPLLLISSDMNHYASERETRLLDETALSAMAQLDPEHFLKTVNRHDISMCGVIPAVIVMETLRLLGGLTRVEHVGHATSADVNGDPSRVVGYAGVLLD